MAGSGHSDRLKTAYSNQRRGFITFLDNIMTLVEPHHHTKCKDIKPERDPGLQVGNLIIVSLLQGHEIHDWRGSTPTNPE
jgi:hypothetical protein